MKINTTNIINDKDYRIREKSQLVSEPYSQEDIEFARSLHEYVKNSQDETLAAQYNLKPAVGIAAVQVGVLKAMFAVVAPDEKGVIQEYALINPKLVAHSTKLTYLESGEGCLSVDEPHPGYVPRYHKVKFKAYDALTNQNVVIEAKGFLAIVLQHEYDHLNGILFYDHIQKDNPLNPIPDAIVL